MLSNFRAASQSDAPKKAGGPNILAPEQTVIISFGTSVLVSAAQGLRVSHSASGMVYEHNQSGADGGLTPQVTLCSHRLAGGNLTAELI